MIFVADHEFMIFVADPVNQLFFVALNLFVETSPKIENGRKVRILFSRSKTWAFGRFEISKNKTYKTSMG
jgi:hypothetical protein